MKNKAYKVLDCFDLTKFTEEFSQFLLDQKEEIKEEVKEEIKEIKEEVKEVKEEVKEVKEVKEEKNTKNTLDYNEIDHLIQTICDPKIGLDIRDRMWRLKNYRKCFIGREFVTWLLATFSNFKTRQTAVLYGQYLMDIHVIKHVCSSEPFIDGEFYYRLQCHDQEDVLNKSRIYIGPIDTKISQKIRKSMIMLNVQFISEDGKTVNYPEMRKSDLFKDYNNTILELQRVDVGNMERIEKIAFFLNVYNCMVMHGFIQYGVPQNSIQRGQFFNNVKYDIGGYEYSLNDIEHGILRGNKCPPSSLSRRISPTDPRKVHIITKMDPRIHFALNCGAKSCPAIKVYSSDNLDKELTKASRGFCETECDVNLESKVVYLSKIFSWYYSDFGSTDKEVLTFISQYVPPSHKEKILKAIEGNFSVKYSTYNWDSNGK